MDGFVIIGGKPLCGSVRVHTAKNAVLPIMAAACMTRETVVIRSCPRIADAQNMLEILKTLGCTVVWTKEDVHINTASMHGCDMPEQLSKKLRSSVFLTGALLARFGRAVITHPGGCEIGLRPIDLHLSGLRALGAQIAERDGRIVIEGERLKGAQIHLDYPSVGATENIMMAATRANGKTIIHNAAREPEIADLARYMNESGARIEGAGTSEVTIHGPCTLHGIAYEPMKDRIEAGTLLCAGAITGGDVTLADAPVSELGALCAKLRAMGCTIEEGEAQVRLRAPQRLRALRMLKTQPYPGFPTDMQSQMGAVCCAAQGTSVIVETVFENRFAYAQELLRMGAQLNADGRTLIIRGGKTLSGARVTARDLRGGAALVLAGLCAQGETVVEQAQLIDRGYCALEKTLAQLGAQVTRVQENAQECMQERKEYAWNETDTDRKNRDIRG